MGSMTCCKCPVCTCGPDCTCPRGEGPGCDPCAEFMKGQVAGAAPAASQLPAGGTNDGKQCNRVSSSPEDPSTSPPPPPAESGQAGATPLTPEEQQAVRKERRDRAREAKLMQTKTQIQRDKADHPQQQKHGGGRSKRRWGGGGRRGKGRGKGEVGGAGSTEGKGPDLFDEWLGVKLSAWAQGGGGSGSGGGGGADPSLPPEGSGVTEEIDFDSSKDEIGAHEEGQGAGWLVARLCVGIGYPVCVGASSVGKRAWSNNRPTSQPKRRVVPASFWLRPRKEAASLMRPENLSMSK